MPTGNIINLFLQTAQAYPERVAFIHEGTAITFGELLNDMQHTAGLLHSKRHNAGKQGAGIRTHE